jgi:hypothetical protein
MGHAVEDSESKTSNDSLLAFMDSASIAVVLSAYSKKSIQVDIFDNSSLTSLLAKVTETPQLLSLYRNLLDELAAGRTTISQNMV